MLTSDFPHLLGLDRIKAWMGNFASSLSLKLLDDTQDPCQDFYKYACGGFKKRFVVALSLPIFLLRPMHMETNL